ncbi:MAG: T9SS type A sorting domain-containing protein [Bacteroidetes bacterium]|nr:T9SS type A sorting domain-containing protein [Bacteroidota bacterium]
MKRYRLLGLVLLFCIEMLQGQTVKTIGTGGNFATLKAAFDAINAGSITGNITLTLVSSTTEAATAKLNASGSGSASYSSVTIYPTGTGFSISGNLALPLIDLNGADNVTIDGRVNASGSTKDLSIINTNTSGTSNTSTIRYINSAENNIIKFCTIKGGATGVYSGVLLFSSSSSGNGNDGNTIDNCYLTGLNVTDRPYYVIYSYGSTGHENDNNIISNSYFYDFFRPDATTYGIYIYTCASGWNITGNSFYETTSFVPTSGASYFCIRINSTSGLNFLVSNNCIGGSSQLCGGSAWNINSSQSTRFYGIHLDVAASSNACSLQNNLISNFNVSSSNNIPWMGIDVNSGNANIGTETGNTIGEATGTGSIVLTNSTSFATSYGIYVISTGNTTISNNSIGSITAIGSSSNSHSLNAIYKSTVTGTTTISNNIIGSTTTPNSLQTSSSSTNGTAQTLYGILSNSTGNVTIANNMVANLFNAYLYSTATNGGVTGIYTTGGVNTILNNSVWNLSTSSPSNDPGYNAAVIGITQRSSNAGQTISGNKIYSLSCTYTGTRPSSVIGLCYTGGAGGTNTISNNFIYGFTTASTAPISTPAILVGLRIYGGSSSVFNNIVTLGSGVSAGCNICGIYDSGTEGGTNNVWFNTVYIGGSVSGPTASTYGMFDNSNSNNRDYRDNILYNNRSGGTTGKHYGIRLSGNSNLTINYNDYYAPGSGGVLGYIGSDKTTLASWQSATGQDANSVSSNPGFANPGGTTPNDYLINTLLNGTVISGITADYNAVTRGNPPKPGALESNTYTWQGTSNSDFSTAANWVGGVVPPSGANILFATTPSNNCVLDQDRIINDLTNAQSAYKFVLNGHQLTVNGNLNFTSGAQIDATATNSTLKFNGSTIVNLPLNAFLSNTINNLTLYNSSGLKMNGNLTVTGTLWLANGALSIGSNTLTINGLLTVSNGSFTGGSNSNIVVGGSGASIALPTVSLNNLTLNRANGISLDGNVSSTGTLTLSNGSLVIGNHTLTVNGTLVRTSGTLTADETSTLNLGGSGTQLVLPSGSFTSNSLGNLTISRSTGAVSNGDITLLGILSLAVANPSPTQGSLDMGANTLTMGPNSVTSGIGDVTGIVKRTSFVANTPYSFGSQFTTFTFSSGGVMPDEMNINISIGNSPSWKTSAAQRYYDIKRIGGSDATLVTFNLHYLDTELNTNPESDLVIWDYHASVPKVEEHGKATSSIIDNWVGISNRKVTYFDPTWNTHVWTLSKSETPDFTWQGTPSSDWADPNNWSGGNVPTSTSDVVIPDAASTAHDPVLPSTTSIKTLTINNGAILEGGTGTSLTITGSIGAWLNLGTFDAGTSTIIFTNANATMSDPTNFYNLTIASGASLTPETGNVMRIAGTLTNNGILRAAMLPNTIEFNGADQVIIMPNGLTTGYYNLVLSGSGTKSIPSGALDIYGNMIVTGTTNCSAGTDLSIHGNFTVESGASFTTGAHSHTISGDILCDGTINATASSTVTLNGSLVQELDGVDGDLDDDATSINFYNLIISNTSSDGVRAEKTVSVNNNLSITNGSKLTVVPLVNLTVSGTIVNSSGVSGLVIKSDGTGSGSLTNSTGGVNATIERYIAAADWGTWDDGWHFLSSPVAEQSINDGGFVTIGAGNEYDFYAWSESDNLWVNFKDGSSPTFSSVNNNSTNFQVGKGYLVEYEQASTKEFKGALNVNDVSISGLTVSSGQNNSWHLLGNPYPCALRWYNGWTSSQINPNCAIWNESLMDYSPLLNGDTIPAMNGFMVQATENNASLTIPASSRTFSLDPWYKSSEPTVLKLTVLAADNHSGKESYIVVNPQSTNGFDPLLDGTYLGGFGPKFYSLAVNQKLSVNMIPGIVEDTKLPFDFIKNTSEDYILEIKGLESFPGNVILEDKKLNVFQKLDNQTVYAFSSNAIDDPARFIIHLKDVNSVESAPIQSISIYSRDNRIIIEGETNEKDYVRITDMMGRVVYASALQEGNLHSLATDMLCKGVYIVNLYSGKDKIIKKVILP